MLPALGAEPSRKRRWSLADEFRAWRSKETGRISRKDVVLWFRSESGPVLETELVRLPPENDRINRPAERAHAVVASRPGTVQPIHAAIGSSDEAIRARRNIDNDLPHDFSLVVRPNQWWTDQHNAACPYGARSITPNGRHPGDRQGIDCWTLVGITNFSVKASVEKHT